MFLCLYALLSFVPWAIESASFDPDTVDLATRNAWCTTQTNNCALLCGGSTQTETNDCDSTDLTYACTCRDGSTPNLSLYRGTIPTFECEEANANCTTANADKASAQPDCQCGTIDPSDVKTSTTTASATGGLILPSNGLVFTTAVSAKEDQLFFSTKTSSQASALETSTMTLSNGQVFTVFGNSVGGSNSASRTSPGPTPAGASSTPHASSASSVLTGSASISPSAFSAAGVEGASTSSSSLPSSIPSSSGLSSSIVGFLGFRYREQLKRSSKAETAELAAGIIPDRDEDSSSQLGIQSAPGMESIYRPGELDAWGDGHLNGGVPRRQEMTGIGTTGEMWTPHNTHELSNSREVRELEARRKSRREPSGEVA
ncbi:MAG: hypothetical protein HETSPECPRED_001521 [Heterodermia speciosa]|uniref:DUF7707 domain-containing protein n=1 Tax=Heterodermia speciosa TaxID=116794 RepID=A0A8H3PFI2_9LECA|nr:MAG: hypothetical protein HETSPECPRED_001521 [Heterodermia speciosa]